MMLLALQLEQEDPHPLQLPFTATKPRLHVTQKVEFVQEMQFREQPPQLPLMKTWPGGQEVQFEAAPAQVTQLRSQAKHEEELERKEPTIQSVQIEGFELAQERQFGPHLVHREASESNA